MEILISKKYYPIAKNIFQYLDLKSLSVCYDVSENFKYFSNKEIDKYDYSKFNFKELVDIYNYFPNDKKHIIEKYMNDFLKCDEELDFSD